MECDCIIGSRAVNIMFLRSYLLLCSLLNRDEGQDLVEYALVVALIALGCVAAMQTLAGAISSAFVTVSSEFAAGI